MTLTEIDWSILYFIQDHLICPLLDAVMPFVSTISELGAVWVAAGILMIITKKYRRQGILIIFTIAMAALIGSVYLKPAIARFRPCWIDTGVRLLVDSPKDYSFPSGHASSCAAAAYILMKTDKRFGCAAVLFAGTVIFSRLYLFVHFPSDVLAGAVLGIALAAVIWKYGMPLLTHFSCNSHLSGV